MSLHPQSEHAYTRRVNHVLDTIHANLTADLSLERLAGVAGFSPYHFHRIFKMTVGETLSRYVWRARVERGAVLLRTCPHLNVSDVAATCGFTSLAGFSRAFKQRFGLPPTRWITYEPAQRLTVPDCPDTFEVTLRRLPAQHLAYVRVPDAYNGVERIEAAYFRLLRWYEAQGGDLEETTLYGMSHDDPDITPLEQCRFDWCLSVPTGWAGAGDIAVRAFPACEVATVHMVGGLELETRILNYMWRCWLPRSHYQPADLPAMEIYRRLPHETGWWAHFDLECAIPVAPL